MRGIESGHTLRRIHALFDVGTAAGLSDGELLERYTSRTGEAAELAFAALVERHGPVVYRVCRRMLRDPNDAQDAFQAAFLVLIRKARSIRNRDSVGSWLYGVALRVAADSRAATSRRAAHERNAARGEVQHPSSSELSEVVTEEVGKLPEKFRVPILLCDLEGYTCEEVARRLGWPLGTVRSRLTRGKERLRSRLERRGLAPSASVVAAALRMPAETVPPGLVHATLRSAVSVTTGQAVAGAVSAPVFALSEGVVRSMLFSRIKLSAGALMAAAVTVGTAGVLAQATPDPSGNPSPPAAPRVRYEIRISVDGKPSGEPIVAEVAEGSNITVTTSNEAIHINRNASKGPAGMMGMGPPGMVAQPFGLATRANSAGAAPSGRMGVDARLKNRRSKSEEKDKGNIREGDPGMMEGETPGMGSMLRSMMAGGIAPGGRAEMKNAEGAMSGGTTPSMMEMGMMRGYGGMMGGPPPRDQEQRLQDVERKLDEILKRLDDRKGPSAK